MINIPCHWRRRRIGLCKMIIRCQRGSQSATDNWWHWSSVHLIEIFIMAYIPCYAFRLYFFIYSPHIYISFSPHSPSDLYVGGQSTPDPPEWSSCHMWYTHLLPHPHPHLCVVHASHVVYTQFMCYMCHMWYTHLLDHTHPHLCVVHVVQAVHVLHVVTHLLFSFSSLYGTCGTCSSCITWVTWGTHISFLIRIPPPLLLFFFFLANLSFSHLPLPFLG